MSSVIVLSDSDEPSSPIIDRCNENEFENNEEPRFNDTSFDFPEVPFCRQILENWTSQTEDEDLPNLNVDNGYKRPGSSHTMSDSHDSDDNRVEKTSRKAAASKKDKVTLKEERLKRQQAEAREKALKAIEKKKFKDMKPGECLKFMEINLDRNIDASAFRTEIENVLRNADIKVNVTTELISNSITWQRNIEDNYIGEDNKVHVNKSIQMEEYIIVVWSNYEAVKHVAEGTFCAAVLHNKSLIPNYNVTLVIFGMEEYFAYRKKQKTDKSSKSKGSRCNNKGNQHFETFPIISRQQLEMCMTEVQIVAKCSSRLIENAQDLGLMVYQYTKSISEIPYKLEKRESQENKFDWYVMGDNKNTVRVDKDGNGLKRLWQQQLCQFNLSSLEISEAICAVYPSPVQLIKAYRNCTPEEGMNLLKDIPNEAGASLNV
ncbi:crossover junction endonuclease EME1-like isoform X2 [Nylanderia fulva]|uniref:crossover junction endonuclease EME1-like isoform X2 n=1 Tax=Nylanderia fulva TaxID=613905 RepID=UPI0010FB0A67|nr:crossover junction endonuclease EME1-like isoform X2 [Nylanderia fulva]XP_029171395.1 crossover junction endonuclease EME1-like isoform X2 [Nylanderia fulva]